MIEPLPVVLETAGEHAGIATLTLDQPGKPVVVLDHELIQRLQAALAGLPRQATGLVVRSASERVFVAGADLKTISEWDDGQLLKYLEFGSRVFGMIAALPFPTAAAINGAALGGGLELAMHCDGLIGLAPSAGGKPYAVGLPEASLGLCPGWGGTNLLPARVDPARAIMATAEGKPFLFDEAKSLGLFDATVGAATELVPRAKAWIGEARKRGRVERDGAPSRWIGRVGSAKGVIAAVDRVKVELPGTDAAAAVVEAVDAGLSEGWGAAIGVERRRLTALRHTPTARAALEAFFARSKK